jgi:hypothetical protein
MREEEERERGRKRGGERGGEREGRERGRREEGGEEGGERGRRGEEREGEREREREYCLIQYVYSLIFGYFMDLMEFESMKYTVGEPEYDTDLIKSGMESVREIE